MTNEEMRPRMECLKMLLEGIVSRIETLPPEPTWDDVMDRGSHLRMIHELFHKERDWFMDSVATKDRSMEILALIGFMELHIKENGTKLVAMKEAIEKNAPAETKTGNPLTDLINDLTKRGAEVHVLDLAGRGKKEEECNNPDCPVHCGKKKEVAGNN